MCIKLQRMGRHEIKELTPFKFTGELDYSYFVNIVNENLITEELLKLSFKKLEINKAYFYMQIHHMMEDNIIEYCKVKKIDLNFLQKVGNYKFAQILIKDVKTFLQMFHIVNFLTVNMEDITLFSTEANLKISTNQRNKGFFKAFPIELELTESTTILVPDDTNSSFTFYSNEAKFSPESLKLIFRERMIDIY